jgi:Tfp pilus assembly protein PilF
MSGALRFRAEVIWSVALVLLLALSVALAGCGGEDSSGADASVRGTQASTPQAQLPPPPDEYGPPAPQETEARVTVPEPRGEVTYEEAEGVFFERRYDEAADLFALYTERKSENPWGYYMLGLSAWKAGDPERAEQAFGEALELDPGHVKSWLNLSRVLLDEGRAEEALTKIEEALAIDPESGIALRLQGRAYHQLGRREEAIESYRQAILIDDQDAWSMNNMGLILIEEERFAQALPALARAVELRDDVAIFHNNLGVALERAGFYRAAEQAFKAAIALDGSYDKASVSLARVETLVERPGLDPVDLGVLAQSFIEEVETWRETVAMEERTELVEPEPIVVSEAQADTTEKKQER